MLWHTLERADALRITLIDRGEGDSEAKRHFSTDTVQFGRANFFAANIRARLARVFQAAEWRCRRARNVLDGAANTLHASFRTARPSE